MYLGQYIAIPNHFQNSAADSYGYGNVPSGMPGLSANLLQLNVYFKSLNVKLSLESPEYESVSCIRYICDTTDTYHLKLVYSRFCRSLELE